MRTVPNAVHDPGQRVMDKVVYFSGAAGKFPLGHAAEAMQALLQIAHQFFDSGYLLLRVGMAVSIYVNENAAILTTRPIAKSSNNFKD